jgi:2-dehydropantoate 2-reductase
MIDIGRYPHGAAGAGAIVEVLAAAGLVSDVRDDIMRDKRGKLLTNLANAIEALCGRAARQSAIAERVRAEGVAVFAAAGLDHADDVPQRANLVLQPIRGIARSGGSTWQSLARKRPVETDYLNGEIVLLGRLHGVPTPINARMQRLVADAAREGRQPATLPLEALE